VIDRCFKNQEKMNIYVLKLQRGKYYIGSTISKYLWRIDTHYNKHGSKWTQIYKPKKVVEVHYNCDEYEEDRITLKYMSKYGIENVRGGTFCKVVLPKNHIRTLKSMIRSCHFVNECYIPPKLEDDPEFEHALSKISIPSKKISMKDRVYYFITNFINLSEPL
jgi:predicted GIY-YIG superfamily endonuclease